MRGRARIGVLVVVLAGCGGASATGPTTPAEETRRECTAALRFAEPPDAESAQAASADEELPRTDVALVLICENEATRRLAIGSEVGACFSIQAGEGSLLRARCWWAGQGALIDVRREGGVLEVRRGDIDEHTGTGALERVGELPVPEDADVRSL